MPMTELFQHYINTGKAKLFVGALFVTTLVLVVSQLFIDPKPADLSESSFALTSNMLAEWQGGDLIVFVRHLERCSRVDAACLNEPSGITWRASAVGLELRKEFVDLGLTATDVYSSPLIRTSQTSALLFAEPTANKDFLYQCKKSFVQDALAQKTPGRNLVLITHSSCMDEVNDSLSYAEVDYEYGTAVFVNVEADSQQLLGFIDTDDWAKTLKPNPES